MAAQFFEFSLSPMPQCHNCRSKSLRLHQCNSGQCMHLMQQRLRYNTIWYHFRPFLAISDHLRQSWTISDHYRPSWLISDHLEPFHTVLDHLLTILDHFLTIFDYFLTISGLSKSSFSLTGVSPCPQISLFSSHQVCRLQYSALSTFAFCL